jgi:hypothetical protein
MEGAIRNAAREVQSSEMPGFHVTSDPIPRGISINGEGLFEMKERMRLVMSTQMRRRGVLKSAVY